MRASIAFSAGMLLSGAGWCAQGETLFNNTCAACHQKGGIGTPGIAPPLTNSALWSRLGPNAVKYIAGVMLFGMSGKLDGPEATLIMPPQDQLSDADLAAIGSYVLKGLNGVNSTLDAKTVAAVRTSSPSHFDLRALRK